MSFAKTFKVFFIANFSIDGGEEPDYCLAL